MLTLTKKTDYALIAMAFLADRPGQCCSARQIAAPYGMKLPVLMNILKTLHRRKLVGSVRGSKGGYRMAREPEQISLADLIEAVEGPIRFVHCADKDADDACIGDCPIRGPILRLHRQLSRFLETTTLADLVGGTARRGRASGQTEPDGSGVEEAAGS